MQQPRQNPMPSMIHASEVFDQLYGDTPNKKIPKHKIFEAAAKASIAPDVMTYFRRLPDKEYTKQELIDQLNNEVKARHRAHAVGLFRASYPGYPVRGGRPSARTR